MNTFDTCLQFSSIIEVCNHVFFCLRLTPVQGLYVLVLYMALRNPCLPCFKPQKEVLSVNAATISVKSEPTTTGASHRTASVRAAGSQHGTQNPAFSVDKPPR